MSNFAITFSPTGGTLRVVQAVTSAWQDVRHIDLSEPAKTFDEVAFGKSDLVAIAMPVYSGRIPAFAVRRLLQMKADGSKCVIIAVYGNRAYEDALVELQDTAAKCGFDVIAAITAVAEHSIMRQFATGRPDKDDAAELAEFGRRIMEAVHTADSKALCLPGNRPYKNVDGGAFVPKATHRCTGCGICARSCPAQAIDTDDPRRVDKSRCIGCFRCVSVCPEHARRFNPLLLKSFAMLMGKAFAGRKPNELFI
ncbi:MAG: 4Fe-4S binding protein [Alistipes sp.]|nr:4Fe-4S binding protein [Alistipes sp.]